MTTNATTSRRVAEELVKRLGEQDQEGIQELFAPEIDWFVPGSARLPWTGRRTRREEVAPFFTTMWSAFKQGMSKVVPERMIVDSGDVMLLGTFTHTAADTGKEFTTPSAMHLLIEDGQIVRLHLYEDTLAVEQAFSTD
ncbi:nuclear transport factor 2 family protein [Streptomyces sp. NPDC049040]|uniref:nuclear transport factor 2 family protein n=1 Tax=Streptomyces sp. NPDC049040 TaxID=3365593 RepID=UPI003716466D